MSSFNKAPKAGKYLYDKFSELKRSLSKSVFANGQTEAPKGNLCQPVDLSLW